MSRRFLITAAVLAALLVVAVSLVATLQLWNLRGLVGDRLSAASGRSVSVSGQARLRPGLSPGLRVDDVVVAPAEGSVLHSARIGHLAIALRLWPLLFGDLDVDHFELDDAEVVLEPSATESNASEERPEGRRRNVLLKGADIRNLKIELRRAGGATTNAALDTLTLRSEDDDRRVQVSAAGGIEGIAFELSGRYERGTQPSAAGDRASIEVEGQVAGAKLSGQGWMEGAGDALSAELRMRAEAPDLAAFSRAAQRDLPRLGPVSAVGRLALDGGAVGVSDLDLKVGSRKTAWLEATGYARDLAKQRGFSLEADFGVADLRALGPLVGNPPDIGTLAGKATVSDTDGTPGIDDFKLKGGREGVLEIDAEGRFGDVKGVDDLEARIQLEARDLAVLGELFHRALPPIGPAQLSGQVSGRAGKVTADAIRGKLDRTQLQASFSGLFRSGQRPRVTAQLEIPVLHLDDIGIEPDGEPANGEDRAASATGAGTTRASSERLFADAPLELGWSQAADGELSVHADQVAGAGGPLLDDLRIDASLADGALSIRHIALDFDGGSISGETRMDTRASPPTLSVEASAKGVKLGELVAQIDADRAYSGRVDAKLDLKTQGASPRALVSGLDGEFVLSCGAGTIATAHAGLMTRDLFHSLRRVAGRPQPSEVLNCLVADFEFRGGVGTARALVLDAQEIVIVGEGEIDLGAETIDLRLLPKPRRASPLSTAATVRVTGALTDPKVKIEKRSLAKSSAEAALTNLGSVTGVRLAWRKLRGGASDRSPCAKLVGAAP